MKIMRILQLWGQSFAPFLNKVEYNEADLKQLNIS